MEFTIESNKIYAKNAEGKVIAEITFPQKEDSTYVIDHTFVDDSLRGQGVAGQLVQQAVDTIKAANGKFEATCSYAQHWLEKHPDIEPLFEEYVDFDTFSKSDFRVVKVKDCSAVKKSKKLLQFTLDDGTGKDRTILSGIHAYYEPEDLVGKTLVAITNLPPRSMMGIDSCGMLLSAVHEVNGQERLNLIMVDDKIPAGAKLY